MRKPPDRQLRLSRRRELKARTVEAIQTALKRAGVVFIDSNGRVPGLRLERKTKR